MYLHRVEVCTHLYKMRLGHAGNVNSIIGESTSNNLWFDSAMGESGSLSRSITESQIVIIARFVNGLLPGGATLLVRENSHLYLDHHYYYYYKTVH